jgi:hypothetical protein
MISSIVHREFAEIGDIINIAWTPCDDILFTEFIKNVCSPCNLIDLYQTYYGMSDITLILCNNRLTHLDRAIELAKFLCCPILIVDHDIKSNNIKDEINTNFIIQQVYSVALSEEISLSWGKIHNNILSFNIMDSKNKEIWRNLIFQLSKSNITINKNEK